MIKNTRKLTLVLIVMCLALGGSVTFSPKKLYAQLYPQKGDFVDTPWGILKVYLVSQVAWNCLCCPWTLPSSNPRPGSTNYGGPLLYTLTYIKDGKNTGDYPWCDQSGGYAHGAWTIYFIPTPYPDTTPTWPPSDDPCKEKESDANSKCNQDANNGPPETCEQ